MISALLLSPALDVTYRVPGVAVGEIHRPSEVVRLAGGKALNLARAAAVLGESVRVVVPLGGHVGALVADLAAASGLVLEVVAVGSETRSCVSAIPDEGAPTEFYEPVPALGADEWAGVVARASALPAGGWFVVAGRLPAEVPVADLADLLRGRRGEGDRIAIDSSGAGVAELVEAVRPELLKVNRAEAAELTGAPGTADEQAAALHRLTGGMVVVTDGADGAAGTDGAVTWRAHPDPQPGRFAIGSGDSFLAGLLVGLGSTAAPAPLGDALHAASAAGSANARVIGAGVFDRDAYDEARTRIHVDTR